MSICKKYNIPSETVVRMVRDGVISGTVAHHHEIWDLYQLIKQSKPSITMWDCCVEVSTKMKVSPETVRKVVYTVGKRT